MDSSTLSDIMSAIRNLIDCDFPIHTLENWLYGAFDGYDYSEIALESKVLKDVSYVNPELGIEIHKIFGIIKNYPRI
jgi:hypothetical protein